MQVQSPAPPPTTGNAPAPTPTPQTAPAGAAEVFQAQRARRRILGEQLQDLESKRSELVQNIQQQKVVLPAERAGVEKRISDIDQRIADIDKQITAADLEVAKAAALPGATTQPPRPPRQGPPDGVYALGAIFMLVALLPLSIAYARRIWRRGATVTVKLTSELSDRMAMIEKAVDAVAIEVERIGEGQRFVTQILADSGQKALGAGAAEPIVVGRREGVPVERESRG
jgi:hypothetical protein